MYLPGKTPSAPSVRNREVLIFPPASWGNSITTSWRSKTIKGWCREACYRTHSIYIQSLDITEASSARGHPCCIYTNHYPTNRFSVISFTCKHITGRSKNLLVAEVFTRMTDVYSKKFESLQGPHPLGVAVGHPMLAGTAQVGFPPQTPRYHVWTSSGGHMNQYARQGEPTCQG